MNSFLKGMLVLAWICIGIQLYGQQKFIRLTGKVTDAQTQLPIPFANLQVKSTSIGTATNTDGEFIFKITESQLKDSLIVSCIGYKSVTKVLSSVGLNFYISLEPSAIQLDEVTVKAQTGLDILKTALARVPENYDTSSFHMMAFYREDIGLGDFQLNYNEAVLDIFKIFKVPDEKNKFNDQLKVVKGRSKKIDYSSDFRLYLWIKNMSNSARSSLADLIKYRDEKYSPFNPRNFKYYNFEYAGTTEGVDGNLIVIDILPKKTRKATQKLKVFLDEESLAITRYDWDLTKAGVDMVERHDKGLPYAIMSVAVATRIDYSRFMGTTTFKRYNGKWYLNSATRRLEMLVNSRKRNMVDRLWHGDNILQITDIDTSNKTPITDGNIGNNEQSMQTLVGNNYDEAFWENFNIVKPVIPDSLKSSKPEASRVDTTSVSKPFVPNRQNGFTRADTLRGKLTPIRTCYDVTFYHLDVKVDMNQRSVSGNNLIRFNVVSPFRRMQVDLYENMKIDKIVYQDRSLSYSREFNAVFIDFPEELKRGTQSEIRIYYKGIPKTPDWSIPMNGGALWDKDSVGNPWAQMVCQGSGASVWWPNKDHQSDEPDSMKIWITIPSGFTEISNGRLIRKTALTGNQTRYEWFVSYPINNYDVTYNIGKYSHFTDTFISGDTLTIDYYAMSYNLERSKKMFRQVKPMLECFEKNFGKYPFRRDGFTLLESIYPMEHQSGVCIGKITQQNSGDTNPLMWHEAAHEWWGNAITCKDIADMWIHEAFATYAEAQVIEYRFGKEEAYNSMLDQVQAVRNMEPVIGMYDVNHIYYDIGDMYSKGSLMLHTLRNVINNDSLWVGLLRGIQDHFRYKTLSSEELVAFINQKTKTDYTYLFDQYLKYTSLPKLDVKLEQKGNNLSVHYRWVADVRNFRMPVMVTKIPEQFSFIYPATEWKTMVIKNMKMEQFEVDEDKFYIDVDIN